MSNFNPSNGIFRILTMASREKFVQFVFLRMEQCIRVIGKLIQIRRMEEEFKFGQMDQGMMVFGKMGWLMVMEDWFMPRETSMKVNGLMIKPMVMEFILISTEADTKDNGTKTSNTD